MPHRGFFCNRTRRVTNAAATARNRYPTRARAAGSSVDRAGAWPLFPVVDGSIERRWLDASQSSCSFEPACQTVVSSFSWAPAHAAYSPASLRTVAQGRIGAVADEAAATLGLFAKVAGLLSRRRLRYLPPISGLYRLYVRYATQFPLRLRRRGLGISSSTRYIEPVVMCTGVATWSLARVIWQTGWPAGANRTMAICARPSPCRATRRGSRHAISSPATPRPPI